MVKVFGKGDDDVRIEGVGCAAEREQVGQVCRNTTWNLLKSRGAVLGFSDGTLLEVLHDPHMGYWGLHVLLAGTSKITHRASLFKNATDCTDEVTLDGEIAWVVCTNEYQVPNKSTPCANLKCHPTITT